MIYQFDPENKIQLKGCHPKGTTEPVKFKAKRSGENIMATTFWDCEGIILIYFLKGKKTVNSSYYEDVLKKLKTSLAKKTTRKIVQSDFVSSRQCPYLFFEGCTVLLREFRWKTLPHPPHSSDLAPSDFFLFPKLKESLKDRLPDLDP